LTVDVSGMSKEALDDPNHIEIAREIDANAQAIAEPVGA
jgi:hypothetical protein